MLMLKGVRHPPRKVSAMDGKVPESAGPDKGSRRLIRT